MEHLSRESTENVLEAWRLLGGPENGLEDCIEDNAEGRMSVDGLARTVRLLAEKYAELDGRVDYVWLSVPKNLT